jgi:hypothetical protein
MAAEAASTPGIPASFSKNNGAVRHRPPGQILTVSMSRTSTQA